MRTKHVPVAEDDVPPPTRSHTLPVHSRVVGASLGAKSIRGRDWKGVCDQVT